MLLCVVTAVILAFLCHFKKSLNIFGVYVYFFCLHLNTTVCLLSVNNAGK